MTCYECGFPEQTDHFFMTVRAGGPSHSPETSKSFTNPPCYGKMISSLGSPCAEMGLKMPVPLQQRFGKSLPWPVNSAKSAH